MNLPPVLLAPSVIKSLAKRLRTQSVAAHLTVSQSHEVMARALGHRSWHAVVSANKSPNKAEPATSMNLIEELLANPQARKDFYTDCCALLDCHIDIHTGIVCMMRAATITGDNHRLALCEWLDKRMNEGARLGDALKPMEKIAPMELFAIRHNEINGLLREGLKMAGRMI